VTVDDRSVTCSGCGKALNEDVGTPVEGTLPCMWLDVSHSPSARRRFRQGDRYRNADRARRHPGGGRG
jgi:hypothetical protein